MIWEIDEAPRRIEGLDEHGRARPEYAASLGLVPAPFGRRALSTTLEVLVYLALQLPLLLGALPGLVTLSTTGSAGAVTGGALVVMLICAGASALLTTAYIVVQLVLLGRRGVTLGKAVTGLRTVNVRTLERPGFWRGGVVRALVLWASFVVPVIGPLLVIALSPFFDPERRGRGWPDLAAATWCVDVRNGLHPYDAKRMRIARKTVATDLEDVRSELPSLATPVDERGPSAYIPTTRNSGGVLGALRTDAAGTETDAPAAGAFAPAVPVGVAGPEAASPAVPSSVRPGSAGSTAGAWVPPRLLPDAEPAAPDTPAPPVTSAATPAARTPATVTLDTGQAIHIRGDGILVGRDPAAPDTGPRLDPIAITDPSMSVSKTHLAILRSGGGLVVIDLGSTNGSALLRDGTERPLAPREQVELRSGDTIRLGDRHASIRIG
ncbi:RDD family protein [Microbacterium timonense]|uniref:RDD family protein n=1 Tax=Microbacterium timonense TaxID=2086576 RepID=UPI000D0EEE7B|nr:RDD family protein [Microbacterium timonense]